MIDYVIGIDLGATKIALGLIAPDNRIIARRRLPTLVAAGPASAVERMAAAIAELAAALPPGARLAAVGMCSPGPIDHAAGLIIDPPNLTGWRNVPLRQMMIERLGLPVALEHDAKAAALGEYHYGAGRGEPHMIYIVAGTGVGAAIIIDGQLYRGMHNFAGEVGHITIDRNNSETSGSNVPGSVQSYLCGPALAHHYRYLCEQQGLPIDSEPITGELVAVRAAQGDALAAQVMTQAGEALGIAVASMAMILDIELYVVGGSVVKAGELLLTPARQTMPRYCFESVAAKTRIQPVALGDDSPLLGCAWLARQTTIDN
jgi:glucokinase